ncbi:MAG: hypothetical protein JRI70_10610 [Deltaproteobacteria bacterium]|nr:hypothetical protein [Deltaproteobacteria bacterium]
MASPSPYRITGARLLETLDNWDQLMNFRTQLIACGGTALTLLELKESTKDVDFVVPVVAEYERLMKFLKAIGYREKQGGWAHPDDPLFLYQFWYGSRVFTTDLLDSPLQEGRNILIKQWRHIYLGALNLVDLIITKVFRGTSVDMDDCIVAFEKGQVDPQQLLMRYVETASYDPNSHEKMGNLGSFADRLVSMELVNADFVEQVRLN